MIGFSFGCDISQCAPREDFLQFFELMQRIHEKGARTTALLRAKGKGAFPLIAGRLFRGYVPFADIDALEAEVTAAERLLTTLPVSMLGAPDLPEDSRIDLQAPNLAQAFARIFAGIRRSVQGSREYREIGYPEYPVRVIVAEIPAASTMLDLPQEAFFDLDQPPLWTFFTQSREGVVVLDLTE